MKQRKLTFWFASWFPFFLALFIGVTEMKISDNTRLQIRLRYSDGTAVTDETVILERLPEEEQLSPICTTSVNGECIWIVNRGLYQLLFERPLDNISALALAEGGLRGFGITVGDTDVTYHFTFHSDGRVYFDAAPEAAVPSPIIPVGDMLHGGIAPTPTVSETNNEPVSEALTPKPTTAQDTAVEPTSKNRWHLILFISGGLVIGGGLYFWSRHRQTGNRQSEDADA